MVRHGVERPRVKREFVQDVVVSAVLLLHQLAEALFSTGAQVLELARLLAVLSLPTRLLQHPNALCKLQPRRLVEDDHVVMRERQLHDIDLGEDEHSGKTKSESSYLSFIPSEQGFEHELEAFVEHLEHFVIVRLDGHLEIQARELRQMPVRVRVLSAEDGADLEDALHVRRDAHLLCELRALREARGPAEVVDLEHGCPGFCRRALELGRMDLRKSSLVEERTEQVADARLDAEDGLRRG